LDQLAAGLGGAVTGTGTLADAVRQIADAVGKPSDPKPVLPDLSGPFTLPTSLNLLQATWLVESIVTALSKLSLSAAADSGSAALASTSAAASIGLVYAANCVVPPTVLSPADCTRLQDAITASGKALTKSASAGAKSLAAAGALSLLNSLLLTKIEQGLVKVREALEMAGTTSTTPGVYEGLLALQAGLVKSVAAAKQLATGGQQLAAAGQAVGVGGQELAAGNAKLSAGAQDLTAGAKQLTEGSKQLTSGLGTLAGASGQLAAGGQNLAQGASDLQDQGTATILNQVVDSSSEPALANAYLSAASARATEAAPYPAPDGAVARVAYSFTLTPPGSEGGPTPAAIIIGALFLLALAMLGVIRVRRPVDPIAAAGGFAPPPAPADPPSAAIAAHG
jgi:putative membrane protein